LFVFAQGVSSWRETTFALFRQLHMAKQPTLRILALSLVLVSGGANAGLFSKKKKAPPPPAPIPLEFSGSKTAAPTSAPMDRLLTASSEVQQVQQWVAASKDNAGLPFIVVDKTNAQVYAFTPYAQLKATAPILLGAGVGDKVLVAPDAPMSAIPPQKRITPAGRYVSKLAIDPHAKHTILSIDPHNLISLHIVAPGTPAQRRAERLLSTTTEDNRVSFGCINVPPGFFTNVVEPDFAPSQGVVYILPEKTTAAQLFGFQPTVTAPARTAPLSAPLTAPAADPLLSPMGTTATVTAAVVPAAPSEVPQTATVPAVAGAAAVAAPDTK
jgi:hypothetical protein